jgi:putative tryptophan/tyrosine transport system substrate-binding protein
MRRREFIAGLGSAAAWPLTARAQQSGVPVVGFLSLEPISQTARGWLEFRRGLAENGFFEGQNITFEFRVAGANIRPQEIAQDLLNRHPAMVVAAGGGFMSELKAATSSVPIVFISGLDPISSGFVESFNRPGGNVTGIDTRSSELVRKRLSLLLELVPQAKIIGYLGAFPDSTFFKEWTTQAIETAKALGKEIVVQGVRQGIDIERAFASFAERKVSAITVAPDSFLGDDLRRSRAVVELASLYKMPAVYGAQFFPRMGGLMSYTADAKDVWHQLGAQYVARILKGAKPADLPVQQPTKFELVINLKTAKALGLNVPPTLLARADEVIEYMRYRRLGIRFWAIPQDLIAKLHLQSTRGVIVTDVDETGAAKPAGIQAGDVIIRMDGKEILELQDLPRIVAETPANKVVEVVIIRAGVERSINVTLGPEIPRRAE